MFRFGPPYAARELFNREREMDVLVGAVKALKKGVRKDYALIGVRRIGKTSLLKKVAAEARKAGAAPVLLDCEGLGLEMFARHYGAAVLDALFEKQGIAGKLKQKVADAMRQAPAAAINALAELAGRTQAIGIKLASNYLEVSWRMREKQAARTLGKQELLDYVEKTLDLPEQLARAHGVFFAVMLDEFQTAAAYSSAGFDFFAAMRRNTQRHERVNYIVAGSNIGMMKNIVLDPAKPFGANFMIEWIGPFDEKTAKHFLKSGFAEERTNATEEAVNEIVAFTGGHPAYLNWFGEQCARLKRVGLNDVRKLEEQFFSPAGVGALFEKELARISRETETKTITILRTIAAKELRSPTEISREVGGISPSNVINYLKRLESYGYLQKNEEGKPEFADPMLKRYLAERQT